MKKINIISSLFLSVVVSACGGGSGGPDKPDLCKDLSIERCNQVILPVASSSASSSSEAPPVNNLLPFTEHFAVENATQFFNQAYKPLLNPNIADPNNAFYYATSGLDAGRLVATNGKLTIGNARFTIGQRLQTTGTHINPSALPVDYKVGTTSDGSAANFPTKTTWGDLDLAHKWKISFCVQEKEALSGSASNQQFMIYVDNNTSASKASKHGENSLLAQLSMTDLVPGKRVEINIPGDAFINGVSKATILENPGTTSSFVQLRVPSAAVVTMSDLWVGYQSDTSTEPAGSTCTVGTRVPNWNIALPPAAPLAPSFQPGNQQLTVSWPVAAGAASYSLAWNTVDSVEGATLVEGILGTSTTITGLQNGTTYYVFVKSVNTGGTSAYSPSTAGVPEIPATAPGMPAGLAVYSGNQSALVTWAATDGAASYSVAVNTQNDVSTATVTNGITDNYKRLTGLVNNTPYYVFVKAVNLIGSSPYSDAKGVTPSQFDAYQANFAVTFEQFFDSATSVTFATTPAVQTIGLDNEQAMALALAGESRMAMTATGLRVANARFTLGMAGVKQPNGSYTYTPTTTQLTPAEQGGTLNLANNYRICYTITEKHTAGLFRVYVDNNTTTTANSSYGTGGRLINQSIADIPLNTEQCLDFVDGAHYGTAKSFIQVNTDGNASTVGVVLSSFKIVDLGTMPVVSTSSSASSTSSAASSSSVSSSMSSSTSSVVASSSSSSADSSLASSSVASSSSSVASSEVVSSSSSSSSSEASSSSSSSSSAEVASSSSSSSSSVAPVAVWSAAALDLFGTSTSVPLGSVTTNTGTALTLTAKGGSVNSTNRKLFFASKDVTGDFVFTARLSSVSVTGGAFTVANNNQFRFGILATESIAPVASYPALGRFAELGFFTLSTTPTYQASRAYKLDMGGATTQSRSNGTWAVGDYLRIAKSVNAITLSTSSDGVTFTAQNTSSFVDVNSNPISTTMKVGFFAASGADELTLAFDNISITQ